MSWCYIRMRLVLCLCLLAHQQCTVSSFSLSSISCHRKNGRIVPTATSTYATASKQNLSVDPNLTAQKISDELLRTLQRKAATNLKNDATLDDRINSLVRPLIASKVQFDPVKCIDGPLFASVHFIGDTPLWERIGAASGVRNVKGQKYTLPDGATSGTFINYAEIWGENFYLKAVGNCKDEGPVVSSSRSSETSHEEQSPSNNPFEALISMFNSGNNSPNQPSALLQTPYDYSASVTGASIVLFQKFSLDLTIEGTGTVRVLYADENLRIFLSPTDTKVTKGGGDWESEGLIVVQVRTDLVYDDWTDLTMDTK